MKKRRFNVLVLLLIIFIISAGAAFIRNSGLTGLIDRYKKTAGKDNISAAAPSEAPEKSAVPEENKSVDNGNEGSKGSNVRQSQPVKKEGDKDTSKPEEAAEDLDNTLLLVNKEHSLKPDYAPKDLIKLDVPIAAAVTSEERMLRKEAAGALKKMFNDAKKAGLNFGIVSGYRSYKSQKDTYDQNLKAKGKAYVDKYVAMPGQSEHQSGLAMDVGVISDKPIDFAQTKECVWLKNNCQNYGVIIRYPSGKESITGYNYEPWHVRYVGLNAAKEIKKNNMVLEEYLKSS